MPDTDTSGAESLPGYPHGHGCASYGLPGLREAARRFTRRGGPGGPEQIVLPGYPDARANSSSATSSP